MTVQVPDPRQVGRRRRFRLALTSLAIVVLMVIAVIWIANPGSTLASMFGIGSALLGILIAVLQWHPQPRLAAVQAQAGALLAVEHAQHSYEQIEGVTLDVTKHKGALIVYTKRTLRGSTINLSFGFHNDNLKADLVANVIARKREGSTVYVAVFLSLVQGDYTVHTDSQEFVTKVNILPSRVAEVDWR
jgi:hypothetical protein